jgi:hypothetical protein
LRSDTGAVESGEPVKADLSPAPGPSALRALWAPKSRFRLGDVVAVAVLVALPALVFGVPALLGHPVYPGDDLTQNFPLRVLAGQQIRHGQLPLYNPYIWSGAPLLAGWNAGAAYPLTFLFAIVPATAAWTLNLIVTWAVAGLGMFLFLRALRLGSLPSVLGGLSFAFAGAMSAQVGHFGLVAGMSWVPVQLLAVLRLCETRSIASRLGWTAVLGGTLGLTILAGEPRAIDDAGVIVFMYAAWQLARLGRRCGPAVISVAGGVALGICLGAVQWLPGLATFGTSQRALSTAALFDSGSLPHKWLLLLLVPDLLGGSGSFGQPAYFAHYNLAEVTGYVGVLPLVAAFALLGRFRLRPRPPEWIIWHVIALAGLILALGGNTPAGQLLVHLPLFGGQRLQSRNILVADLALAVLLAYWADRPAGEDSRWFRLPRGRRVRAETVLGVLPALAMVAVVVLGLFWGAGLLRWLGVSQGAAAVDGRLKLWLVPYALIGAGAIAFVIFGRRLQPRVRSRWLGSFIAADLVVFTLLSVVAVRPGLVGGGTVAGHGSAAAGHGSAAARHGTAPPGHGSVAAARSGGRAGAQASAVRPVGALGYPGRFAIYDPDELGPGELPVLGAPDLNVISGSPSIQGYTSLVDGRYASVTGSHRATGEGQDVLSPRAVGAGVLDQLGTTSLLTVPGYLITPARGASPPPGPAGTGQRYVAAGHQGTWYFGTTLEASRIEVPDTEARRDAAAGTQIGLITPGGPTRWFRVPAASASLLAISLPQPVASVAMSVRAGGRLARLGPPAVAEPDGRVFIADGQLQNALVPPRWGFAGHDGSFAVFVDHFARHPLSLAALPGRPAPGATVRRLAGPAAGPTAAAVFSPHGVRVIRAVAAIQGWSATWHPRAGQPAALTVDRAGLVQAVDVPPGRGVVTWSYVPPGFPVGIGLSLAAAGLIVLFLLLARWPLKVSARTPR